MKTNKIGKIAARISGGLLVVLAALAAARYHNEMRAYRQHIESLGSQVIETACGPIAFVRAGSGYPVLVIHGNGGGFDQGLGFAEGFLDEGFQVIAPSRFGYLGTPLPEDATVAMQADAYACLLDTLDIKKAAVLTTSAGVTSSIQFALRHPERVTALVLHSPNAPGKVDMQLPPRQVFQAMFRSDFVFWALTTWFGPSMQSFVGVPEGFQLTDEMRAVVNQTLKSVLPSSARADGMVFDTFVSNPEINQYRFDGITTPTLVVSAVDDPMALHENARVMAKQIPGARLVAISSGGHLMLGHAEEARTAINAFLHQEIASVDK